MSENSQLQLEVWDKIQNPMEAMHEMGMAFAKSGLLGLERVEAGELLAWACMCERKSPIEIDKQYHIIMGKLSQKPMYSYAVFVDQGGTVEWIKHGKEPDQTDENREAVAKFTKNGQTVTVSFSMADAKKAGLVRKGSTWETFPHKMLQNRVLADGISLLAPGISCGLDDYSEPSQTPAKQIQLTSKPDVAEKKEKSKKTKTEPKKEESTKVVEAEIVAEEEGPFPPPEKPKFEALPEDVFENLQKGLGNLGLRADKWMRQQGWLKDGMTMEHLAIGRANTIIEHLEAFKKRVKTEVPA